MELKEKYILRGERERELDVVVTKHVYADPYRES
jgi:hypothetical protein